MICSLGFWPKTIWNRKGSLAPRSEDKGDRIYSDTYLQNRVSQGLLSELINRATLPKNVSGNACLRLCWFVQQCTRSPALVLRDWVFSRDTYSALFDFYIEWNENDPHRSMKLVLDQLVILVSNSPRADVQAAIKRDSITQICNILTRKSTRPTAKSAMKLLDHFLSKKVFDISDLSAGYREVRALSKPYELYLWRVLVGDLVRWMSLHYICPIAGKLVVTITRELYSTRHVESFNLVIWEEWLEECVTENPQLLDSLKTYLFTPLFKADRAISLEFLQGLNQIKPVSGLASEELDVTALVQLAALEVGKKTSLVEDPESTPPFFSLFHDPLFIRSFQTQLNFIHFFSPF